MRDRYSDVKSALDPLSYYMYSQKGLDTTSSILERYSLRPPEFDNARGWHDLSPALNAESVRTPILLQMSEGEFRLGMEFYANLVDRDKPIEMFAYVDEGHQQAQPAHKAAVYTKNVDWFRFWLQGFIDADPSKAAQFKRWEELKRLAAKQRETK